MESIGLVEVTDALRGPIYWTQSSLTMSSSSRKKGLLDWR